MSIPKRVPLWADRNGRLAGYFIVDPEDYHRVVQHRWYKRKQNYPTRDFVRDGKHVTVALHRFLLGLEIGDRLQVDHINRNRMDNRRCNLRVCTHANNNQNRSKSSGKSSDYRGVCWHVGRKKWYAAAAGKYLGAFDDELDAARAAAEYRKVHMPFSTEEEL